ncbi:uncharacterized protein [Haliotis cracherodii]|uniref:uncharacterized protein n=1 Tax=Haliotis cracherodii TaxID=6455 RepID=UPI0039ED38CD
MTDAPNDDRGGSNMNIAPQATSNFSSGDNRSFSITGQAAWVTDGVTSGNCSSVSSLYPQWKAEFGQNMKVSGIKIFWGGQQDDIIVSVDGKICHTPNSSYTWMSEYSLVCEVPLTGSNLLMYRAPTVGMLNLSLCEVEIYAFPEVTSSFMSTSTTTPTPTTSTTLSTTSVTTPSIASSTVSTETTTTPTTSIVSPTVTPISASSSKTPRTDPAPPGEHDGNFPILYIIVLAAGTVGVVTIVATVTVVSVRRTKRRRSAAKDAQEAVVAYYEECVAEPREHKYSDLDPTKPQTTWGMVYENVQHGSDHTSMYVNTTATTSYENIQDDECTYVNNDYDIEQDRSNGRSCYVNTGYNIQHMKDSAQASMYVNTTDLGLYENTLNIRR